MRYLITFALILSLSGCTTVKKYWPRDHDPALFDQLVAISIAIDKVNCEEPNWAPVVERTQHLSRYAEWRADPQSDNLKGLSAHAEHMSKGGSKKFCELGKKTAAQRIEAAKTAWEGR